MLSVCHFRLQCKPRQHKIGRCEWQRQEWSYWSEMLLRCSLLSRTRKQYPALVPSQSSIFYSALDSDQTKTGTNLRFNRASPWTPMSQILETHIMPFKTWRLLFHRYILCKSADCINPLLSTGGLTSQAAASTFVLNCSGTYTLLTSF